MSESREITLIGDLSNVIRDIEQMKVIVKKWTKFNNTPVWFDNMVETMDKELEYQRTFVLGAWTMLDEQLMEKGTDDYPA
jgi:hypothetical protein